MKKSLFVGIAVIAFAVTSCKKSETTENMDADSAMTVPADDMSMGMDSLSTPNADSINTTVMPDATGTTGNTTTGTTGTGMDSAQ